MKQPAVIFQEEGRIGIIRLNRPGQKNAINRQVTAELSEVKRRIGYGSPISVLVITGEGPEAFSIGTDTAEYAENESRADWITRLQAASVIGSIDRPVIAAINGDALGQGLELALACDMRIASSAAQLAMPQIQSREIPWDGGTQRLARLVGRGKALEMILCGEPLTAAQALEIGLVNQVVPPDEVFALTMKTAREMAAKGPIALRYAKEAILKGMDMTLAQGLAMEADLYFLLHTTADRTEGITAFREKRTPNFEGK
jgi:enoyl-CoA hydratase/carnithine racemase